MKRELDEDDPLGGSVALPHADSPAAKVPRVDEAVAPPPASLADARAPSLADAFEHAQPAIKSEPAPRSDAPESDLPPAIPDPIAPEHEVPEASPTADEPPTAPAAPPPAAPAPAAPVAPTTADGPARDPTPPPSVAAPAPAPARQPYPRDPYARWRAIQTEKDPFTRVMLDHLRRAESTEPYHQVGDKWRREPWEPNPYESIGPGFVVARDMPQPDADVVLAKLTTDLDEGWMDLPPDPPPPPSDETPCVVCERVDGEADFVLCDGCPKGGHYACLGMPAVPTGDWFCPECVRAGKDARGIEANGDAGAQAGAQAVVAPAPAPAPAAAAAPPPFYARAPVAPPRWENRQPLRLGVDVEERPMWGMDCYTRVAVNAALSQAPSFAGDDADARCRRELFFSKLLMPAVHTMGVDGWDLAAAVRKVRANAAARGNEGVVAGCDCVLRAIHEVDEANIDTVPPPKPPKGHRAAAAARARAANKKSNEAKGPRIPPGVTLKKPLGSYMLFAADARGAIAAEHPEFSVTEIAKELGSRWKKIGADVRAAYDARAKEAKRKYDEEDLPAAIKEAEAAEAAALVAEAEALKAEEAKRAAERAVAEAEAEAVKAAREERMRRRGGFEVEVEVGGDGGGVGGDVGGDVAAADGMNGSTAAEERPAAAASEHPPAAEVDPAAGESDSESEDPSSTRSYARRAAKRRHFRLHPKGVGVVCIRPEGIEAGTYVQDYLGELYSPWRWYERQDAIKKREPGRDLPDFFNITLERPAADAAGYDVLFVEAAHRCTFASRLSHSCAPNCHTVVVSVGGKLTIAQYATRKIEYGEELCWNYSCVTESEKEYRAAICLCSSTTCKGAFLDFAGSSAFTAVMNRRHNFLDRNAALVRACSEPVSPEDRARLATHGVKSAALTMPGSNPPEECPAWLVKWAALALEYVELEKELLPAALMEKPLDGIVYDRGFAEATAAGVVATRVQNLVITLDKIKYVLRQEGQCREPFLRTVGEEEIIEHLWDGPHGILRRAVDALAGAVNPGGGKPSKSKSRSGGDGRGENGAGVEANGGGAGAGLPSAAAALAGVRGLLASRPTTAAAAREGLEDASRRVRAMGPAHAALADALFLYARTETWVTPERYQTFFSEPVKLVPLPKDHEWKGGEAAAAAEPAGGSDAGDAHAHAQTATKPRVKLAQAFKGDLENVMKKKYQPHFTWGQMVAWFKQTIYDPSASLSADRRGTMSLPDPESAYAGKPGVYGKSERKAMLAQLDKAADKQWPTTWQWSFRNPGKVYGSPWLDDAIRASRGEETKTAAIVEELRCA